MSLVARFKNFFKRKRSMTALFIDEAHKVFMKKVKYENNTFFLKDQGLKEGYIVDYNFMLHFNSDNEPVSFYYINNPHPIVMQHQRNKMEDSVGFKHIYDSKHVTDLFAKEATNLLMVLMIIMIVSVLLTLIGLLIQFHIIKVAGAT